jgi:uncharacterized membrane protein
MHLLVTWIDLLRGEFKVLGEFWWMAWNAILAIIPAVLAIVFFKREEQPRSNVRNATFGLEMALILLFLPNAPYIATDVIHFLETVRISDASLWQLLWNEFPIYAVFVLFGLTCYAFTVDRLLFALRMRLGGAWAWAGLLGIPLLSAIGIYLGRVARYNSWDILINPRGILHSSRSVLDQAKIATVLFAIWLALIVVHQVYRTFHDGIRARLAAARKSRGEISGTKR